MGDIHKEVMKRLSVLPYYEARVLEFRYGTEAKLTVEEVAIMVGKSVKEVKELERSGLSRLRQKPS